MDSTITASYLRVATLAVVIFDFVQTTPAVWRLYKDQWLSGRFTISCVLLAGVQVTSIMVMTTSNIGWFGRFSHEACLRYWRVPLAMKVLQAMACQAVIGVRAFSLSRRSARVGWSLLSFYSCVCILQWVTTMYKRQQVVDGTSNCRTVSLSPAMGAWLYYLITILYDTVATIVVFGYLIKHADSTPSSCVLARVTRMMAYDGLGYLIVLSASNIFNLVLYISYEQLADVQSAGVSVSYAVTWIMSQRLITHLHEAYLEGSRQNANISHVGCRSLFQQKNYGFELTVPEALDREAAPVGMRVERVVGLQGELGVSDSELGSDGTIEKR